MVSDAHHLARLTTVLLIDDDEGDRRYWSGALRSSPFHYSVLEADAGEAGLNVYRRQSVDCVILNLDMAQSGFLTLVRLVPNRKSPQIPVVILTRLIHPSLFELVKKYGASAKHLFQEDAPWLLIGISSIAC